MFAGPFDILNSRCERLSELNYRLINWVCKCLEINTEVVWSNQFPSDLE
ncbi:MAG: WbqC family protein [Bdellovibrionales bacterium]|nr:WbqC family protein [Bdellovibrionales bacterium]